MSQYRKATNARVEKDQILVAFHPEKLPHPTGTFVRVIEKRRGVPVVRPIGVKEGELVINLTKEGVWAYDPTSNTTLVAANVVDKDAWPKFTPRMEAEGWNGKAFEFNADELITDREEKSPGYGLEVMRHTGETIKKETGQPFRNVFLMTNIHPVEFPEWRVPRAERMGVGAVELPLPPKPARDGAEEIIAAITPWLDELNSKNDSNVSHGKCSIDFKRYELYVGQACHRCVQEEVDFKVAYLFTIGLNRCMSTSWRKGQPCDEALRLYITYLTSYSPYADVFITKDPDYILEHGYILDANKPNRLVVGAMYATRQTWERPQRAEGFLELYKAGLSLDTAFVFGCQTSIYKDGKMKMAEQGSSHSHLNNGQLSDDCILNFIDHSPAFAGPLYTKNIHASYGDGGVDGMWSKNFGNQSKIYKTLAAIKGEGSMSPALPIDDVVERAADAIEDWQREMEA